VIYLWKDRKMDSPSHKTQHNAHNPLSVPVSAVGNGFVAILPNTSASLVTSEPLAKSLKNAKLEHINTPWLAPFLEENKLTQEHAPQGVLVITREAGVFQVRAHLSFSPLLECARCLESFRQPLETYARAVFTDKTRFTNPVQNAHRSGKHKEDDSWDSDDVPGLHTDDLDLYEYSGLAFCLDEFLLDAMQTEIPDIPICAESCPGLCSQCGSINTPKHPCRSS
jgi:uncharacterized metal-binding protein YceD (DUF177 family)